MRPRDVPAFPSSLTAAIAAGNIISPAGQKESACLGRSIEACQASVRDTWGDNHELSVRVQIRKFDLYISGFYYPENRKITHSDPRGKRELAEKFL